MGLFDQGKKGEQCVQNQDGSITCRRIKKEGEDTMADGSEITFGIDQSTCKPIFTGEQRIMDSDREWAQEKVKREVESCRRGLA
jgi:ribosomal protein L31